LLTSIELIIGPLVSALLAVLLLSKDLLGTSGKLTRRSNLAFNLAIAPLLIIFFVTVIIMLITGMA
jgi:hypothetical protein